MLLAVQLAVYFLWIRPVKNLKVWLSPYVPALDAILRPCSPLSACFKNDVWSWHIQNPVWKLNMVMILLMRPHHLGISLTSFLPTQSNHNPSSPQLHLKFKPLQKTAGYLRRNIDSPWPDYFHWLCKNKDNDKKPTLYLYGLNILNNK